MSDDIHSKKFRFWTGTLLRISHIGTWFSSALRSIVTINNNQARAIKTYYRMDKTSEGTEQVRKNYKAPFGNNNPYKRIEYQTIDKIENREVKDIPVYNLSTEIGTYLAEGYLVHNCGIPVVGFNWGFNREWLVNGWGCELVEPGNIEELSQAIDVVLKNWKQYSRLAMEYARAHFGWDEPIQQIYDLYSSLLEPEPTDKISVVIPLHNYANWVGEAIQSAKDQTVKPLEIIVVDDASTDHPVITEGVKVIRLKQNVGVATARNIGIEKAKGNLIICLDADDKLEKDYIQRALPKFKDPRTGIAYGPLSLVDENGKLIGKRWFDAPFLWIDQAQGRNRIPTCCMFRKEAWRRTGGYRKYESPAEDAGLWTRIASQGWNIEFINDGHSTLFYRMHNNSLSRLNKFPDWVNGREWKHRNAGLGYPVQIYDCPTVSFVLDYSKDQEQEFIQAVDNIEGLAAIDWEICASGKPSPLIKSGFPFVRWGGQPSSITSEFPA